MCHFSREKSKAYNQFIKLTTVFYTFINIISTKGTKGMVSSMVSRASGQTAMNKLLYKGCFFSFLSFNH